MCNTTAYSEEGDEFLTDPDSDQGNLDSDWSVPSDENASLFEVENSSDDQLPNPEYENLYNEDLEDDLERFMFEEE